MKKFSNIVFFSLLAFLAFNMLKNKAEADARQSYDLYLSGKAIFIDVREEQEVHAGMIKGALWFPLSKIEQDKETEIQKIKKATDGKQIFVYCKSGNRSGKVKRHLEEAGIKSINIGGYSDLVKENLPTQDGPK